MINSHKLLSGGPTVKRPGLCSGGLSIISDCGYFGKSETACRSDWLNVPSIFSWQECEQLPKSTSRQLIRSLPDRPQIDVIRDGHGRSDSENVTVIDNWTYQNTTADKDADLASARLSAAQRAASITAGITISIPQVYTRRNALGVILNRHAMTA